MSPAPAGRFDLADGLASRTTLNDGHRMPVLGLGVWKSAPGRETREAVRAALQVGYRSVDTASMYGNEADVGAAVRESGVPRDEVFLTTKVWNDQQGYEGTLRAFEQSRQALGVEVVDLYLIHWPVPKLRSETWRALQELQRDGRCRSIGVSNYGTEHLEELLADSRVVPSVNQVEFSPFLYQRELLDYCRGKGIQLEAYAPLTRGRRLDEPVLAELARAHHRTPAQLLLRWGLEHGVVEIPKSVRRERIEENARIFDFELPEADRSRLDGLDASLRTAWDPSRVP
jgi:diketogulonate reductase-like aldo/keto reductase